MGLGKQMAIEADERAAEWLCKDCMGAGILDHNDGEYSGEVTCFTCEGRGYTVPARFRRR